jgi:hypothetical protein
LDLRGCEKITDAGIQGLCVSVNHLGKEDLRLGQCKSIETLNIEGTKITKKGIQTALLNLPFLKKFEIPGEYSCAVPVQFLAEMHQPDCNLKRQKEIRKYSLDSLFLDPEDDETFNCTPYTSGSLGLVASLCPSVTSVDIILIPELTDSDLLGLLSLKNVNKLGMIYANRTVTFEGGVVPLLKGFGSSLKELSFAYLEDVNIRAIIDFCPKLQSLSLDSNDSYSTTGSAKEDVKPNHSKRCRMELLPLVLRNLEKLWMGDGDDDEVEEANISSEDLLSLLPSPSLIDINIFKCDNLTDYIFERASEIHQFLSLKKLTVCHCQYVTHKSIDVVMNKKTPLSKIYIGSCGNITDDDIDLLISNARSEKWELSVGYDDKRTEI